MRLTRRTIDKTNETCLVNCRAVGEKEMIWWLLAIYLLWVKIGLIRFFMLMGRKNYKETLLDKVVIAGAMPVAYLLGVIRWIIDKVRK